MKQLTIFRILTYTLVPIAGIFVFFDIIFILYGLASLNPLILLVAFILSSFLIYTYTSLRFLTKGIDSKRLCNPSLRKWIRANAFVSLFMCVNFLSSTVKVLSSDNATIAKDYALLKDMQPNMPPMLNAELYVNMMRMMSWFTLFLGIVLLVHIAINFRLMKQYQHVFDTPVGE